MNTKTSSVFGPIVVILIAAASILPIGTNIMTYAQETLTTPETVYSQENVTGTQNITGITSNEEADDKGEIEEGPGEDDDEPGDIDVNDKED